MLPDGPGEVGPDADLGAGQVHGHGLALVALDRAAAPFGALAPATGQQVPAQGLGLSCQKGGDLAGGHEPVIRCSISTWVPVWAPMLLPSRCNAVASLIWEMSTTSAGGSTNAR